MPLNEKKILKFLDKKIILHTFDSVDSTNNEAKRRAYTDGAHLFATQHQTAGRGRKGHDFYSPKDTGLYMTLALPLEGDPADVQRVTCASAVAVCRAVERLSQNKPQIKWVNDIFVDGKKVAGILTELLTDNSNRPISVIIGIGLNLQTSYFPDEFAEKAGNLGKIEPNRLCADIANEVLALYNSLYDNSFIEEYKTRNLCIGKEVTFTLSDGNHLATAVNIADDGGLIVVENGKSLTLNSGEISVKL